MKKYVWHVRIVLRRKQLARNGTEHFKRTEVIRLNVFFLLFGREINYLFRMCRLSHKAIALVIKPYDYKDQDRCEIRDCITFIFFSLPFDLFEVLEDAGSLDCFIPCIRSLNRCVQSSIKVNIRSR